MCDTKQHTETSLSSAQKNTPFDTFTHISNIHTWTVNVFFTQTHTHSHKHPTKTSRVDSQKISLALYLQHPARAHVWQSGNASGPLKPKPIRSLMQTCRAPLSFISPFNVRGLESDSITYPKEKKEKGKIIRGSKLPTCFWVDLIESRESGNDWPEWAMFSLQLLTRFLSNAQTRLCLTEGRVVFCHTSYITHLQKNYSKTYSIIFGFKMEQNFPNREQL